MTAPTSDRVLERLGRLHPKLIDLSLGRIERLLAALGNPQDNFPPVVHVAGTKGKGSTVATMRACLEAAGYRVTDDVPLEGYHRCHVRDPFGNRLELVEPA